MGTAVGVAGNVGRIAAKSLSSGQKNQSPKTTKARVMKIATRPPPASLPLSF